MSVLSACLLIGTFVYSRLNSHTKTIFLLILITFFVEWLGFYNQYISEQPRLTPIVYQYFSVVESILLFLYFKDLIQNKIKRRYLFYLSFLALSVLLFDLVKNNNTSFQNFKFYLIPMFSYTLFSIFFFKQLLESNFDLKDNPNFWIVTGILFFNTTFFFLSGFINYVSEKDKELAKSLYVINYIINIIYYSLITYGFICQRRLAKSSS